MTESTDNLDSLIGAARQMVETETALSGGVLPTGGAALPELETPSQMTETPAADTAGMTREEKAAVLAELEEEVRNCTGCGLCEAGRTQTVFGVGDADARLMFVGEGPGAEEDAQGIPFVGRSGELLTKMIVAMGLTRERVYIANVVKCRPPGNRAPTPAEAAACWLYLKRQIEIIAPGAIVVLGNAAAKAVA